MSLGPVTVVATNFAAPSVPTFVDDVTFALDASYPAGGYAGLNTLLNAATGSNRTVVEVLTSVDLSGYVPTWDAAAGKLRLFTSNGAGPAPLAEVVTATDLHTVTLRLRVLSA